MKQSYLFFVEKRKEFLRNRELLFEAFKNSELDKVIEKIDSILKKRISGLVPLEGFIDTNIDGNKCISRQYIVIDKNEYAKTKFFQFNWLVSETDSNVYSVDFFKDLNVYWDGSGKSDLSIYTMGTSIVKILPVIWDVVNNDNYSLTQDDAIKIISKGIKDVKESNYYVGGIKYKIYEGVSSNLITEAFNIDSKEIDIDKDIESIEKSIKEASEDEEIKISVDRGNKIKVDVSKSVKDGQKELDKEIKKDPEQIFKEMKYYVNLVIKGTQPSLILCGGPGVGKTYRVKKQLKEAGYIEGKNLCTLKGKCTARRLYLALYEMREKGDIVLIDDADSLVGPKADENCINILKAALDSTTDEEGRLVTYGIAGKILDDDGNEIPKRFYCKSGCIVITNYRAGALDTAFRGRSFMQDINFETKDVLEIVKKLLPNIEPEILDAKSKLNAYNYLLKLNEEGSDMELSLRTFVLCAKIFKACDGVDDFTDEDAESMIKEQMKLQYARGVSKY